MGFTHYWRQSRDFTAKEWGRIAEVARACVAKAEHEGIRLAGWDGTGEPLIDSDRVSLNGREDESCETFLLTRVRESDFNFCKTRERPYDDVVVSILFAAKSIAPNAISVSSDGGDDAIVMKLGVVVPAPPKE
ncbi:MAG: hypothetical protein WC551_08815 [Patescibacteria group bacterium]